MSPLTYLPVTCTEYCELRMLQLAGRGFIADVSDWGITEQVNWGSRSPLLIGGSADRDGGNPCQGP